MKNIPDSATLVAVGIENSIEESSGVNDFFDYFEKKFAAARIGFFAFCHAKNQDSRKPFIYQGL